MAARRATPLEMFCQDADNSVFNSLVLSNYSTVGHNAVDEECLPVNMVPSRARQNIQVVQSDLSIILRKRTKPEYSIISVSTVNSLWGCISGSRRGSVLIYST
jgi:hypothetical protein